MPLHITLNKLVFTIHYIMICPVSSACTIDVVSFAWPRYIGCWLSTGHFSRYLFPGYMFLALFANQILICFLSVANVLPVLSPLHLLCVGWLWTGHCSGLLYLALFPNKTLICLISAALVHWVYLAHLKNLAALNNSPFQYVYFSLGCCVCTSF